MKSEDNWVPWESTFFLFYFHFLKFQIRHPPNQNSFSRGCRQHPLENTFYVVTVYTNLTLFQLQIPKH